MNDKVEVFGLTGYIAGFTGASGAYIKDINDNYITIPGKSYKQVSLSSLTILRHNNNWQYEVNWQV